MTKQITSVVTIDGQTVDLIGDTMDSLERKVIEMQSDLAGLPQTRDIEELALIVHNMRMLLAESGIYNPTVEPGWLLKQRG
jgi:hypothetical protein